MSSSNVLQQFARHDRLAVDVVQPFKPRGDVQARRLAGDGLDLFGARDGLAGADQRGRHEGRPRPDPAALGILCVLGILRVLRILSVLRV